MKYFTSLVLALSLAGITTAQVDDRYMTKDLPNQQERGAFQSQGQYQDQSYIDYEDDSYSTRIRRFHRPIIGSSYYGSIYSPYYFDPFYTNPYVGWGSFYQPGFSISYGYGPYWSSYWGQSAWFGFSPFSYWNVGFGFGYGGFGGYGFNPFGYGYGYGGYWNGYYAGLYDGGYYGRGYRSAINYGPRVNTRGGNNYINRSNSYNANSRAVPAANRGDQTVRMANGSRINNSRGVTVSRDNNVGLERNVRREVINRDTRVNSNNINGMRPSSQDNIRINGGNRLNNGMHNGIRSSNSSMDYQRQPSVAPRSNGIFQRSNSMDRGNNGVQPSRSFDAAPARQAPIQRSSPAPTRSMSPAPSRSSGGSFGGGSRGGSIRR